MTYLEGYNQGARQLSAEQIPDAGLDAWLLLEYVTGMDRAGYLLHQQEEMTVESVKKYLSLIAQRKRRIPLQYLTGEQEFMGMSFYVNEDVLIPRQDTETLVELALPEIKGKRVLDVCTGSGCIAISLQKLGEPAACDGVDLSKRSLEVAEKNIRHLGAEVTVWQSDLLAQVSGQYDVIVSNPPYIASGVIGELMPEVRDHEPRMALDGGEDGCAFYRRLAAESVQHLADGGELYLETGYDQGDMVAELLRENGFCEVAVHQDLAGNDRVVAGVWHR